MPCFHPLEGFRSKTPSPSSGKYQVVFKWCEGYALKPIPIPCGRCVGCRLERSRQWALRCVHEAQLHQDNCFITLTLNDEHLEGRYLRGHDSRTGKPIYGGTLNKKHFQDFMKRVRRPLPPGSVSYFHCGEYGERHRRPHYHALLFGLDFSDKHFYKRGKDGSPVYTSAALSALWPMGFSTVGALTFESAAYCARYALKKITGDQAKDHYTVCDQETGELLELAREYVTMSLKPAIAKGWFARFSSDVYPDDFVVIRGMKMKPPKFYDNLYELEDPVAHEAIKEERREYATRNKWNNTRERLAVRQEVKLASMNLIKRDIE